MKDLKNLDETEEIVSCQTVLRDVFQPLAMGRLIFHCSNVFVSSCFHPLFVRIIDAAPYLGIRACACPVACRSSFTPEPRHLSINQTDGYVFLLFRRLGQDMYVSSSLCHPTAGSQRLNRQMRSFHGSLTAHEFFSCPSHQRRDRVSFKQRVFVFALI